MPAVLAAEDRRKIVSVMVTKGVSTSSIARRIGVPVATVRKDRLVLSVPNPDEVLRPSVEEVAPMRYFNSDKPLVSLDPVTRQAEVAKMHAAGKRPFEIARSLMVSNMTVSRDMSALGIIIEDIAEEEVANRRARVKELLDKGVHDKQIARELGISVMTVIRDRKFLGFTPSGIHREQAIVDRREQVKFMMGNGMSSSAIATTLGVTLMTVIRDCEALGIATAGSRAAVAAATETRRAEVSELFAQKMTISEIASRLDVHTMTVRRDLAALNLK